MQSNQVAFYLLSVSREDAAQPSLGDKLAKEFRVRPFEPHREKTGFLHMRNKAADQLCGNRTADQCLSFLHRKYNPSSFLILNKPLANFCGCTARFASDLVGNPEDRFSRVVAHFIELLVLLRFKYALRFDRTCLRKSLLQRCIHQRSMLNQNSCCSLP